MTETAERNERSEGKSNCEKNKNYNTASGAVYGLGLIGAAIYYISVASSFWAGVLGFLKAVVWPVFLVLESLKFLANQ
jgi:hypothetical protein